MKATTLSVLALTAGLALAWPHGTAAGGETNDDEKQEAPKVKIPESGVPQIMTIEGRYVRAAYNNEGYAILGYKLANLSVGEKWMLLEFGVTVRDGVKEYELKRENVTLTTPDNQTIPLASVQDYRAGDTRALENREKVARDSINYFPPSATRACRIGFFSQVDQTAMSWDHVNLTDDRACLGRLFFQVPGGITYGQYWLNVQFKGSQVRVPFRILTEDEDKLLDKNYKSIAKQVEDAFKPPKKD
jgi:hypothetical protein